MLLPTWWLLYQVDKGFLLDLQSNTNVITLNGGYLAADPNLDLQSNTNVITLRQIAINECGLKGVLGSFLS